MVHQGQGHEGKYKEGPNADDGGLPVVDEQFHCLPESAVGFVLDFHFDGVRLAQFNELVPQHRAHENRGNPGKEQGRTNDPEKGIRIFRDLPFRQAYGDKAGRCNQGARQHGGSTGLVGPFCRFHTAASVFQLHLHHFDNDDGIIHQKPQRYDEGPKGYDMKVDAPPFHEEEGSAHHHRDAHGQHHAAPKAQGQETHRHDDDEGFDEGFREFSNGVIDHLRLVRHQVHVHACREFRFHIVHSGLEVLSQGEVIAAICHGHGDADGRLAVEVHEGGFRIRIGLGDLRHVA